MVAVDTWKREQRRRFVQEEKTKVTSRRMGIRKRGNRDCPLKSCSVDEGREEGVSVPAFLTHVTRLAFIWWKPETDVAAGRKNEN